MGSDFLWWSGRFATNRAPALQGATLPPWRGCSAEIRGNRVEDPMALSARTATRLKWTGGAVAALLFLIAILAFVFTPPKVPAEAIASSVTRTPQLMEKAWQLPVAASFKRELTWQSNPSSCGPASLANIFQSLGEKATSESAVLDDTGMCWWGVCPVGLTLDEVAEVARTKTDRRVSLFRDLTQDQFREHLRRSNDPNNRYVINFLRAPIFGAGGGHHSPIGGYLEAEDLVFVLDVNETFRPWLIERARLFAAMDTMDNDKKRGLVLIEPAP
jgi:hypothetical protein